MSHSEYVERLDEDQLTNLIEQATGRLESIRQSGWVKLWTVNDGWMNVAWLPEDQHSAAVKRACDEILKAAAQRPGRGFEMSVTLERYRPNEAAALLRQADAVTWAAAQGGAHADQA